MNAWSFAREVRKERYTILNTMDMEPERYRKDRFKEIYDFMRKI